MMLSSKVSILLIGGGGYVGTQLAHDILSSDGYSVGLIDLIPCPAELINKCRYYSGSGTDFDFLDSVMADFNPTIVVLIASWGMSGVDMLDRRCFEINVACASNAVKACIKHNISKLIYTSTYNVVFGGQEIINGSESLAYYPVEGHSDCYSASKYMAEDLVLKGNGSKMRSGGRLTTCALRPAAIYGEGERRHLPRILDAIDSGMFVMRIGNATVDWLHVENLSHAYQCMIKKLLATRSTDEANPTVGGHAYFISDGSPVPNFEILRPLCTARGCVYPTFVIPTVVLLYLSFVMEQVHFRLKSWGVSFQPFLLQAEVQKVGVTHYCSIEAAKTHFGYKPLFDTAEGARRLAVYYGQKKRLDNRNFFRLSPLGVWLLVLIPMTQLFVTAYSLAGSNPVLQVMDTAGMWILPYRSAHEWIFWLAVATHTGEALYAHHLASDMGCKNTAILWAIQTVFLGYGSFMLLYKRKAFLAKAVSQGLTGSAGSSSDSIDDEDRKYTNSASNGKVSRMTRSASKPSDKQAR